MATEYDSSVLETFADRLYIKAASAVFGAICTWGFLGLIFGIVVARYTGVQKDGMWFVVGMSLFVGGLIGYAIGNARAFKLRLEAQQTLCQVAIERNVRREHVRP